jgi:hypothetical protein
LRSIKTESEFRAASGLKQEESAVLDLRSRLAKEPGIPKTRARKAHLASSGAEPPECDCVPRRFIPARNHPTSMTQAALAITPGLFCKNCRACRLQLNRLCAAQKIHGIP